MMKYYKRENGIEYDELIGGVSIPQRLANVTLTSGLEVQRGELLAKGSDGAYIKPTDASGSVYGIAYDNAGSIATVYQTGEFNRDAISHGSSINLEEIEDNLRNQGIFLTKSQEVK